MSLATRLAARLRHDARDPAPGRAGRVLHVLKYYRPDFTGEGVFLERCSVAMAALAPQVVHDLLVTHTRRPGTGVGGCSTVQRVSYLSTRPLGTMGRELLLAWWFLRNLPRYGTVHFRTHADWYFVSYLLTRLFGRRLVLSATLDDSVPMLVGQYRPSLRRLAARGFRLFHTYVSISPKLQRETLAAGMDPARCKLIPCGITMSPQPPDGRARLRRSLGIAESALVLLFVGGLCRRKDPMMLVQALPAVRARHPDAVLVLVGPPLEPDYVQALQDAAAESGSSRNIIFAGTQHDPHPFFDAADMLVFGSRLEGFGTVVPEAMAHGLPVVVRRLPGVNDDFVLPDETGYLFEDQAGYVALVQRLAGDAGLRRRIGAAARRLVLDRFGMPRIAAQYLGVYGLAPAAPDRAEAPRAYLGASASVLDHRFHAPVVPVQGPPLLITMVDAEEAFDWSRPFSRQQVDVTSMGHQHRAHRVFERYGIVPLYLADYPVATQDAGRAPLRELLTSGLCEVGAQLHTWVTPPFTETVCKRNSFAGNLPVGLELEKARSLTAALAEAFGETPRIFRTGRFGAGPRSADVLKQLGFLADSSVNPFWQPRMGSGAPSFDTRAVSAQPYWMDRDRTLMQIPVSAAVVGLLSGSARHLAGGLFHPWAERARISGAAARLGLAERIRLSPEGITVQEAKRLVRHMLAAGQRSFVLTYHSPSLQPGNTTYVRTPDDLSRFLGWLDEFYAFFHEEVGGRFGSWRDLRFPRGGMAACDAPVPIPGILAGVA